MKNENERDKTWAFYDTSFEQLYQISALFFLSIFDFILFEITLQIYILWIKIHLYV